MKKIISFILVFVMLTSVFALTGCKKEESSTNKEVVKVVMEIKDHGSMTIELYPDIAPITVENFVNYVKDGFYDGLTFHRIYKDFMIQGGDPEGTGSGGRNLTPIKGEFTANGHKNTLKHTKGVISMARTNDMNSATSQFFICHAAAPHLDGQYAAFDTVVDGFDTLDSIANVPVQMNMYGEPSQPVNPVIIEKVYIVD